MNNPRFLKALLGDDCAGALVEAVQRTPGLEAALTPRAMVAWLAALGTRYSGSIPGVDGSLNFERIDGLYKGEVVVDGQTFSYQDAPGLEVAALLAVAVGEGEIVAAKVRDKDLARLGKSLDKMVGAVLESQQRGRMRAYLAKADGYVDDVLSKAATGHFAQTAFRHLATGQVFPSGPFHNIDNLPNGEDDMSSVEAGFIGHDGVFYNRKQAGQVVADRLKLKGQRGDDVRDGLHSDDKVGRKETVAGAGAALRGPLGKIEPKGITAKPAGPLAPAGQTGPQGPQNPQKQARQSASSSSVPGVTTSLNPPKGKTLKMEKHLASRGCESCGQPRFADGRFVGCPCFSELAKNVTTLLVGAHYLLKFSPQADAEAYTALAMSVSKDR